MEGARTLKAPVAPTKPFTLIEPRRGLWHLALGDLWHYRELLYFLVWRDVKVRYKQTAIGIAWAVLQPLAAMLIMTVVFGYLVRVPSDDLPYALFAYTALVPWTYFAHALGRCVNSVVVDSSLVTKVYFPRLIIPLTSVLSPLLDFCWGFLLLLGLAAWFGRPLGIAVLAAPLFLLLAMFTALAVGAWLSALNVRYRDVGHVVPLLVQVWMFASPIVYPVSLVPERWRWLYSLNPMVGVIEGFRWSVLGKAAPPPEMVAASVLFVAILLVGGIVFFRNMERTFADEI
ncbi:ABC transporter permease [Candidatus Nitrospira bockiana]